MSAYKEMSLNFDQCLVLNNILPVAENAMYEMMFKMLDRPNLTTEEKKHLITLGRMYEACRSMRVAIADQHGIDTESRTDFYNADRAFGGLTYRLIEQEHRQRLSEGQERQRQMVDL